MKKENDKETDLMRKNRAREADKHKPTLDFCGLSVIDYRSCIVLSYNKSLSFIIYC